MKTLAPGLLLAMPQLGDPNFHRSVILMMEHGAAGSMGIVINHAMPLTLAKVAQGQGMKLAPERQADSVYAGGPVEPQRGFILHDDTSMAEKHPLLPGLFLSLTLETLAALFERPGARMRFCLGYAGWGPKQLEGEMAAGSWLFAEAAAESVLGLAPAVLWDTTLRGMGVDPAMLMMGRGLN